MHVDPNSPHATLTKRQQEVLDRLGQGMGVQQIATDIGVSRNAVYQHIERLRRLGAVDRDYTPSGQPPRRVEIGTVALSPAVGVGTGVSTLRELALAGADRDDPEYGRAIEAAVASSDVVALAYELGRLDGLGEGGLAVDLIEAALRRSGALAPLGEAAGE